MDDETQTKNERLQLRMKTSLKTWFKGYSEKRGGMSKIVQEHVENLKEKHENGRDDPNSAGD